MLISSLTNPRVKSAVKLRDRHGRDEQDRIVIDGAREIERAVAAGVRIAEVFVCEGLLAGRHDELLRRCLATGAVRLDVTLPVMEKLAYGQRAEGILAVAQTPRRSLSDLDLSQRGPLVAVLVGVEKPGNLGAVLRSADAAGVSGLIVADGATDLYNPNAIRASLGAIFTVPVCAASSAETWNWLREGKLQIVAARVGATTNYTEIDYRRPTAIILGSEARGLPANWDANDVTAVSLPMLGSVDSLNVSATAAVLFYEALRQRGARPAAPRAPGE